MGQEHIFLSSQKFQILKDKALGGGRGEAPPPTQELRSFGGPLGASPAIAGWGWDEVDRVSANLTYYIFCLFAYKNYDNCSFSIYKKSDAIAIAGKTSPTRGTKIDGRFKLIIEIQF